MINDIDVDRVVSRCKLKFDLNNAFLSKEYYYTNLPLCIIDAVFSIGIRYSTTVNVIEHFSNYEKLEPYRLSGSKFPPRNEQYSVQDLLNLYRGNDMDFITTNIYKNRNRTSSVNGILKSEAVFEFAKVLDKYSVNYLQDINCIKNNKDFEIDIKKIKGQNSGKSLSYFLMLSGEDNFIKVDRMIERFIFETINKNLSIQEILELFNNVIQRLQLEYPKLTLKELDHLIWKYMTNKN